MKILFLIPSLGYGGTEKQLILLSKQISTLGNKVLIGYLYDGPLLNEIDTNYIQLVKIKINSRKSLLSFLKIVKCIKRENPDVVQTFLSYMDIMGGLASFILKKPFILSERSNGQNGVDYKIIIAFKTLILKLSGYIICNSIPGKNFWSKNSPNSKVIYIPNIVKKAESNTFKTVFPSSNFKIILLCRFIEHKNCLLTIKVFCEYQKTNPDSEFILVGEGKAKDDCIAYVEKYSLNPKKFIFKGFKKNVGNYFCQSDIFVSLSEFEGMPNAALEAASYKCPLFLSDISSHRSAFSSKEAFFVSLNKNYFEIARILKKALDSSDLREKKALYAYNSVITNNNPNQIAMKYLKNYKNLIK